MRVGDSYETLRRKMLTYEETGCCRDNVRRLFSEGDEVDDDNVDRDRPQSPPVTAAAGALSGRRAVPEPPPRRHYAYLVMAPYR